ncbi:MAG: TetR/AcrR family transcriptional regulator, partial [Chitinophagales bacterium]
MTENNGTEGRQERRKRELREKIIKVAVELFEKQGFYNTTMEQIAEAADVARKTLYNYFPVKEAIADVYLRDISMGLARENLESLQKLPDTKSRLLAALKHTYGWVENNPELTGVVLGYRMKVSCETPVDQQVKTGTQSVLENILTQGQQT